MRPVPSVQATFGAARRGAISLSLLASLLASGACSSDPAAPAGDGERSWRLGFSATPPRQRIEDVIATIQMWRSRADIAVMHVGVPWAALLDGTSPDQHVENELQELAELYRGWGLRIVFVADVTDGLARELEAQPLRERGRSIAEPEIRALYLDWVMAVVARVQPDYLGLAAETNLVRGYAPAATYDGVVEAADSAASRIAALGEPPALFVSVQVDYAWGRLGGPGSYQGIAQDLADFPYIDVLGLSSYPYLAGFDAPSDVPLDYYRRLRDDASLEVMVVEGGWASASTGAFQSSEAEQAAWIRRQARLLDEADALALMQLTFTDLDLEDIAQTDTVPEILPLFATLGMVDFDYEPKAALAVWDSLYALTLRQP